MKKKCYYCKEILDKDSMYCSCCGKKVRSNRKHTIKKVITVVTLVIAMFFIAILIHRKVDGDVKFNDQLNKNTLSVREANDSVESVLESDEEYNELDDTDIESLNDLESTKNIEKENKDSDFECKDVQESTSLDSINPDDYLSILMKQSGGLKGLLFCGDFDYTNNNSKNKDFWMALLFSYYVDANNRKYLPIELEDFGYVESDPLDYSEGCGAYTAKSEYINWISNNIFNTHVDGSVNFYFDIADYIYEYEDTFYALIDGLGIPENPNTTAKVIGDGNIGDYLVSMTIDDDIYWIDASLKEENGEYYWSFYKIEKKGEKK